MAPPGTQFQELARRSLAVAILIPLLVAGYVGSYGTSYWLEGSGAISSSTQLSLLRTVHLPICRYEVSGLPGASSLFKLSIWCHGLGGGYATSRDELQAASDGYFRQVRPGHGPPAL
jgi:hypothetical protein